MYDNLGKIKSTLIGFSKRNRNFNLKLWIEGEDRSKLLQIKPILTYYATVSDSQISEPYVLEIKQQRQQESGLLITAVINSDQFNFTPSYWDLALEIHGQDQQIWVQVVDGISPEMIRKIQKQVLFLQIKKGAYLLRPHITADQRLSFIYMKRQTFERPRNYIKELLAFYLHKFLGFAFSSQKTVWLICEKESAQAHDSGFCFFKWLRENHPEQSVFFVIKADSPEIKHLTAYSKNILKFMSFRYFWYIFKSKLIISTDNKYHIYNLHQPNSVAARAIKRKKEVYLQHGVNGLKQVPEFHKDQLNFDLIISPSDYETEMIVKLWGYDRKEVATTGLARWDSYQDRTSEIAIKQILLMPTWRRDLKGVSKSDFVKTSYFKHYQALLNSEKLKKMLAENHVRIAFFLHPYFKSYVELFEIDDSVIDKYDYLEVDLGQEIMKSSLMISDYSSVLWEMFYLEKPVIFYQFDQAEYLVKEKAYMDYQQDLFGDCAFDVDTVIDFVEKYINKAFQEDEKYGQMRQKYLTYFDQDNSKRIYQAIKSHEKQLGI